MAHKGKAGTLGLALAFLLAAFTSALAQDEQDFVVALVGDWAIYDASYGADGQTCRITLKDQAVEGGYGLEATGCGFEFGALTSWRIVDGQLALMIGDNQIAGLGGNQIRMSGDTSIGAPVIMDRVGANPLVAALTAAYGESGCYYLGFSSTCAEPSQLAKPEFAGDGSGAQITVQVNLNARIEARDDADVLGVVPANSCIVANSCLVAADGVWCRAQFGDRQGWLKKVALRQEKWPILTFVNQCATPAQPETAPN